MPIWMLIPAMLSFLIAVPYIIVECVSMAKEAKQERAEHVRKMQENLQAGFRARSTSTKAPHPMPAA